MPAPFPGMDPYLEAPAIWPDFHDRFANTLSAVLNESLPAPYYARLESRPEVGLFHNETRRIVPDVSVQHGSVPFPASESPTTNVALIEPRATPSASLRVRLQDEQIRHHYVLILDPTQGHGLVTLIEIVSPSNKQPGADRASYRRKQQEILNSDANLIEIDLQEAGRPIVGSEILMEMLAGSNQLRRYIVCVNRAWQRQPAPEFELYPFGLTESLPCIQLPLRENEDEPLLDLQLVFQRAYDSGPYRRGAIDYAVPAARLTPDEHAWVADRFRDTGMNNPPQQGSPS